MWKPGLLAVLLLAGCTSYPRTYYHWVKAGGDMPALNADWYGCVKENSLQSRLVDNAGVEIVHAEGADNLAAVQCMKARGYTLTGTDSNPS